MWQHRPYEKEDETIAARRPHQDGGLWFAALSKK
jgi:hypothetical protein